jgi:type VI secretion system protein ImpA
MNMSMQQHISDSIQNYFGTGLESFLAPVSSESPAGEYLRYNAVYSEIGEARKQDDSSLPLGIWNHELKRADWPQVSLLALNALMTKTKDIQLVVWLLEAEIHQQGFRAIGPVLSLLAELCREFWPSIHPVMEDTDIDARINPIAWIDNKLLPVLRLTPLTQRADSGKDCGLADWLIVRKNETLRKEDRARLPKDTPTAEQIERAMTATPPEYYQALRVDLIAALQSLEHLCRTLDDLCNGNGPSLSAFAELLGEILDLVENEMQRRGLPLEYAQEQGPAGYDELLEAGAAPAAHGDIAFGRTMIYRQLEQMAHYLIENDPHSPAPYLVLQACRWGEMSTRDLYQELFVNRQGQLHIFDLLGVNRSRAATDQASSEQQ